MTNAYPGRCVACNTMVPAQAGTWTRATGLRCARHSAAAAVSAPAAAPTPPTVQVGYDAGLRALVLTLAGYLGGALFAAYRAAADGSRYDAARKANLVPLAVSGAVLARLRAVEGLQVALDAAAEAALAAHAGTLTAVRSAAEDRLDAADAALRARGLSLYGFQRAGVAWLAGRDAALLADDMGLGKTAQTLLAMPKGSPVLVICPAVAKGVWSREAAQWRPDLRPVSLSGRGSFRWPAAGEMVCVNYDILPGDTSAPKGAAVLPAELATAPEGVVVVLDEAHAAKSSKAQRTRRCRALVASARKAGGKAWGLTATPLLNRAPELWSVLSVLGLEREVFGDWRTFERLFGAERTRWGTEWGTPSPEVAPRLARAMLRRLKSEVLADLPAKRREELTVEIEAKDRRALDKIAAELARSGVSLDAAIEHALRTAGGVGFEQLSRARAALATAKLAAAEELVADLEDAGEPVVVFSAHRAPIDALGAREGWAAITGDTSAEERTRIEAAMQAGQLRGVAATIKAGGVAITLTRASRAIMIDQEWTPALNAQAEDRIYRIGQTRGVLVTRLVADHGIDVRLAQLLAEKGALVDATVEAASKTGDADLGDAAAELDAVTAALAADSARVTAALAAGEAERARLAAELLARLVAEQEARERLAAERDRDRTERERATNAARRAGNRGVSLAGIDPMDTTRRQARTADEAHAAAACATLSALDFDHAAFENGAGWSKSDGTYGHYLAGMAASEGLTESEWRLACAIVRKYHGQIGCAPSRAGEE